MDTAVQHPEPMNPDEVQGGIAADADFTTGFDDYWGTDETVKFMFPDGKQSMTIRLMAEGERARFEKDNNQDLRVSREGETTIKVDPGRSRKALLKAAISDWHMLRRNTHTNKVEEVKFTDANLNEWIDKANPKLIDKIEKAIRDHNEWLKNDMTVEEIDKEIESLNKERESAVRREAGE